MDGLGGVGDEGSRTAGTVLGVTVLGVTVPGITVTEAGCAVSIVSRLFIDCSATRKKAIWASTVCFCSS